MHTSRNTILIVALVTVVAFVAGFLLKGGMDDNEDVATPTPSVSVSPTLSATVPPPSYTPRLHTVTFTPTGVSPSSLTIRAGDAVRFRNDTAAEVWPASDPHPAHTGCVGFDSRRGLRFGEEYTLTFPTAKTCTYHSHLDAFNRALQGTIIVR